MFDILALKNVQTLEKQVKVTCVEAPKGKEPIMTLYISDPDLLVHEESFARAFRIVHSGDGETYQKRDFLQYCSEMLYCVQSITGLFFENGKPVPYEEEYLAQALKKSIVFRQWLTEEIITAMAELRALSEVKPDTKN